MQTAAMSSSFGALSNGHIFFVFLIVCCCTIDVLSCIKIGTIKNHKNSVIIKTLYFMGLAFKSKRIKIETWDKRHSTAFNGKFEGLPNGRPAPRQLRLGPGGQVRQVEG